MKARKGGKGMLFDMARLTPRYRPRQVSKIAPCQIGCVNCGDVRGWIGVIAQRTRLGLSPQEAYAKAWAKITEVNPFPATLGRICPHPCEEHCNRTQREGSLAINALERFLGDYGIRASLPLPRIGDEERPEWIGVVGAGPSGLSFAYQLARRGYPVTVYDAREEAGGMLRYGVPDYRLPQQVLDAEVRKIVDIGVDLQLGKRVGRDISLSELRERHAALYLGIGAQRGKPLDIPGARGEGVWTGTEYLRYVSRGELVDLGRRVVVVGGGNAAVDAARCARRAGAAVSILYRRSRTEMPAIGREIEEAEEEGIDLILLAAPVAIERTPEGVIRQVVVRRMELGAPDGSGRRRPIPVDGSDFAIPADSVIAAISQVPVLEGLEALDHRGDWLVADSQATKDAGIQAGGDALGPGIAGEAIVQGRHAAESLDARFRGRLTEPAARRAAGVARAERVRFASKPAGRPVRTPILPPVQRLRAGMGEAARTISEAEFLAEVERCYSCGQCFGCGQCEMYCTQGCFTRLEEPRPGIYFTLNLDCCQECGKCVEVCPCGYLEAL